MALEGQASTQLSHPTHSSSLTTTAFSPCTSNTLTGQTLTHSPAPVHFSWLITTRHAIALHLHYLRLCGSLGCCDENWSWNVPSGGEYPEEVPLFVAHWSYTT